MKYRFLRFPEGKGKALTLSYDDGCRQDKELASILKEYGVKGTFNINSGYIGKNDWYLTKEQIKEYIIDNGFEVALHGDLHNAPGTSRSIDGIKEFLNCRIKLEKEFGAVIRGMAYPDTGILRISNGANYENIRGYLKNLDIVYARSIGADNASFDLPEDWLNWIPTTHHNNPNATEWARRFVDIKTDEGNLSLRLPRLFYIWGHSYEFEANNNWEQIRKLLEILSHRDDIWYATNIEIYEYTEAYSRLVYSADNSIVYNPTCKKIWFTQDGENYCINPNETLVIK